MRKHHFTLPVYGVISAKKLGLSLSLNWYRNCHYQQSNKAKVRFKKMITPQLIGLDKFTGQIEVSYYYYAKRKGTDLDNFVGVAKKFFQDALTESGLIEDDNCSVIVRNTECFMGIDKLNPRIEVIVSCI